MKIHHVFASICLAISLLACAPNEAQPVQKSLPKKEIKLPEHKIEKPVIKDSAQTNIEVLLISGGASPVGNNYSQYLQVLRFDTFFNKLNDIHHKIFFASGLTPDNKNKLPPDVVYKEKLDGEIKFLHGVVSQNQEATKSNIQEYFQKSLKAKTWKDKESFLLIVADHGLPHPFHPFGFSLDKKDNYKKTYDENCIDLWHPEMSLYPEDGYMSVSELKEMVSETVPNTVPFHFVMTQCYSGAFHQLAYRYNEQGYPVKEKANRCGFTAITKDTTASGCTPFVDRQTYDGYERRMTEELTGMSIIEGKKFKEPVLSLSQAHDMAFLSDHTKDVPLRTSESYILDWFDAYQKQYEKWDEKELEKIWQEIVAKESSDLNAILDVALQNDLKRRLHLIEKMVSQLQNWYPIQYHSFNDLSLREVSTLLESTKTLKKKVDQEIDKYKKDYKNKLKPFKRKYLLSLNKKTDDVSMLHKKFEKMAYMPQNIFYSRLYKDDPTLKKYEDFMNYWNLHDDRIHDWIRKNSNNTKVLEELEDLKTKKTLTNREWLRLDVLYGELRRLHIQMKVAAGVVWLSKNYKSQPLVDYKSFVECETNASISANSQ